MGKQAEGNGARRRQRRSITPTSGVSARTGQAGVDRSWRQVMRYDAPCPHRRALAHGDARQHDRIEANDGVRFDCDLTPGDDAQFRRDRWAREASTREVVRTRQDPRPTRDPDKVSDDTSPPARNRGVRRDVDVVADNKLLVRADEDEVVDDDVAPEMDPVDVQERGRGSTRYRRPGNGRSWSPRG
jgi:hypothetical protein